jgi:hypothetical protein
MDCCCRRGCIAVAGEGPSDGRSFEVESAVAGGAARGNGREEATEARAME